MNEIKDLNDELIKFALEYLFLFLFLDLLKLQVWGTLIRFLNYIKMLLL